MTHISNQQAVKNLFELPEVNALPGDCTQITIGDLHANMMLLLYFLVKNGVVEISAENYKELVEIYKKGDNLTKENFEKFNTLIDSLVIKNKQILIRLIGDEVADRGQNDYFIFKLLAKLQQEDINMEIIVSNHGGEFLMRYEGKDFSKNLSILPYQSRSSNHLQELLDNQIIQYEELDKMIKTVYLPNLKLISYSIDNEQAIGIYTHAPANLNDLKNRSENDGDWWSNSIYHLAVLFNVEYDVSSIPALIKTIDGINEHFRLRLQNQTTTELFQKGQPLEQFIWSRGRVKQQDTLQNGYTVSFIHGHTSTTNDPSRVYNLDGQLGKELNLTSGTLKTLISSGVPAKDLIQKSQENSSNNNTLARNASPLTKENSQVFPQSFGSLKTPVNDKITEKPSLQKPFVEQIPTIASGRAVLPIQELFHIAEKKEEGDDRGDYQARFIEKVQEKLGDSATDASSIHVRPDLFLKYNMEFNSSHTKGRTSYIQVQLEILSNKENPDKIELGLTVGPWFISFKAPGLVACKRDWEYQVMHSMPLVTLRNSDSIFKLMKNLIAYITACNGSMDYDEKKFNEAHFVKYWLEYYRIWDDLSELTKKYLNEYSDKQKFPNIIRLVEPDLATLIPNLDGLCKNHGVEKEQSSNDSPIVLKSNDIRNLDNLFCEIIQIKPEIVRHFSEIKNTAELVRYMAIKQYGYSGITSRPEDCDNFHRRPYNWTGYEAGLKALAQLYGSVKTPVNDKITEKPSLQKPFVEQTPTIASGRAVLPIQELFHKVEKKEEGDYMGKNPSKNSGMLLGNPFTQEFITKQLVKLGLNNKPTESSNASIPSASNNVFATPGILRKTNFVSGSSSTETKLDHLEKSLSEKEAILKGDVGPRFISGWTLQNVSDEGNCFYEAVADQLEMISHDLLKTNLSGMTLHIFLRFVIQGAEKFQDKEWAGDAEIVILSKKLNLVVAVIDTRYPERGYIYYYVDENDEEVIEFDSLKLPNKSIIKLAYTGNHFLSVKEEPVNKKAATGNEQSSINLNVNNKQKGLIKFFASNDKKEPSHKFEAHIQKLQDELTKMISSLQLAATEALRAKKILAGLVEPLPFETPQMLQEKVDKTGKMKSVVNSAKILNELIQTLKEISKGNAINQTQHQQLMAMNVFQQDENIANYNHVLASSSYSK